MILLANQLQLDRLSASRLSARVAAEAGCKFWTQLRVAQSAILSASIAGEGDQRSWWRGRPLAPVSRLERHSWGRPLHHASRGPPPRLHGRGLPTAYAARRFRIAAPISSVPTRLWLASAMSAVRRPSSSTAAMAASSRFGQLDHVERVAQRHRERSRAWRSGWRRPCRRCRGPSRGPARRAPCACRCASGAPSEAEGSMPSEPVSIAAASDRMSPKRLSVTITSNCLGLRTSCIAQLSARMWLNCDVGDSPWRRCARLRPRARPTS